MVNIQHHPNRPAKIAFVFAGQGAQYPGMGKDLYHRSPAARAVFDQGEALRPGTLRQCFSQDAETLGRTLNTQPCVFLTDWAIAAAAREAGIEPAACAGFSLGEVAAAGFCGMMDFETAFRTVIRRAEWMDECAAAHPGVMAAVLRLTASQVESVCEKFAGAYPVNYNCPGQTAVAMEKDVFPLFSKEVAALGGRAVPLKVSGPFHSPFMAKAAERLARYLETKSGCFAPSASAIPLYANRTALPYPEEAEARKALLASQVDHPVLWQKTIENMRVSGISAFLEAGPGAILSGLIQKILPGIPVYQAADAASLEAARAALLGESLC